MNRLWKCLQKTKQLAKWCNTYTHTSCKMSCLYNSLASLDMSSKAESFRQINVQEFLVYIIGTLGDSPSSYPSLSLRVCVSFCPFVSLISLNYHRSSSGASVGERGERRERGFGRYSVHQCMMRFITWLMECLYTLYVYCPKQHVQTEVWATQGR